MSVRSEAIKVVAFLVVGLLVAGLLWVTLGRTTVGVRTESYSAEFADVSGLATGDVVRVAGVRVGQVTDVGMAPGGRVRVDLDIDRDQPVLGGSRLLVRYENLIGDRFLELADGPGSTAPQPAEQVIGPDRTSGALDLDVLLNGFKPLFQGLQPDQINGLATGIIDTLQGRGGTVQSLLEHTASLSGTLADRDQVIGRVVTNLNRVLGTVNSHDQQLRTTLDQLQQLTSGLAGERRTVGSAVEEVNGLTGGLADLLKQARPPLAGTVGQLGRTATVLDDNRDSLNSVLNQIPVAYQTLTRVGSYGSFFNFYLCSVQVKVTGPDGTPVTSPIVGSNQNTPRCRVS